VKKKITIADGIKPVLNVSAFHLQHLHKLVYKINQRVPLRFCIWYGLDSPQPSHEEKVKWLTTRKFEYKCKIK
jgi:hypothetical protein